VTEKKTIKKYIYEKLPATLPALSKSGLILLPNSTLPIVVTQDSVLQLIKKSLRADRLIGVIQPKKNENKELFKCGCLGRVSTFSETERGFLIGLTGICRFSIQKIFKDMNMLNEVLVSYKKFKSDLNKEETINSINRKKLFIALEKYLKNHDLVTDWNELKNTSDNRLITAITIAAPFTPQEKQAILEVPNLDAQCSLTTTLIEMASLESSESIVYH
jgi:uncharacterized protein